MPSMHWAASSGCACAPDAKRKEIGTRFAVMLDRVAALVTVSSAPECASWSRWSRRWHDPATSPGALMSGKHEVIMPSATDLKRRQGCRSKSALASAQDLKLEPGDRLEVPGATRCSFGPGNSSEGTGARRAPSDREHVASSAGSGRWSVEERRRCADPGHCRRTGRQEGSKRPARRRLPAGPKLARRLIARPRWRCRKQPVGVAANPSRPSRLHHDLSSVGSRAGSAQRRASAAAAITMPDSGRSETPPSLTLSGSDGVTAKRDQVQVTSRARPETQATPSKR